MKRIKSVLSKVLRIDENSINDETSPENVKSWDSFNSLILITEFEKAFNLSFDVDEVMTISNVRDIKNLLRKYGVKIKD